VATARTTEVATARGSAIMNVPSGEWNKEKCLVAKGISLNEFDREGLECSKGQASRQQLLSETLYGTLPSVHEASLKKHLSVCLVSAHPLVLGQFRQALLASRYHLQERTLEAIVTRDASKSVVPRASIYVIDSEKPRAILELLISRIMERFPRAKFLLMGDKFKERNTFPLLRIGVKGVVRYEDLHKDLPKALQAVGSGGFWVPRSLLSSFVDSVIAKSGFPKTSSTAAHLSPRENEIISHLLANLSNKEIASKLNISERTVKFHVSNLLEKFNVKRRSDLILLHYQHLMTPKMLGKG
jgi:DNA-binding NarL/FixJ family response regulator